MKYLPLIWIKMRIILIIFVGLLSCTGNSEHTPDLGSDSSLIDFGKKDQSNPKDLSSDQGLDLPKTSQDMSQEVGQDLGMDQNTGPVEVMLVTGENSGHLSTWLYNQEEFSLTLLGEDSSASSITWIAKNPKSNVIYTTSKSTLRTYGIDENGTINYKSDIALHKKGTHVDVDVSGKWAAVASYGNDALVVVELNTRNGEPKKISQTLEEEGFCKRAHQVRFSADNSFAYLPCLGSDFVRALKFDDTTGQFSTTTPGKTPEGSGPRHFDFHPSQDLIYVLNEHKSTITSFELKNGSLVNPSNYSALPSGREEGSASSDIHISPDGKFLYAINRQPLHQIGVFKIGADGALSLVEHVDGSGEHSRSFTLSPDGHSLILGNTNSSNLVIYRRDSESGKLSFEKKIDLDSGPMFVGFL